MQQVRICYPGVLVPAALRDPVLELEFTRRDHRQYQLKVDGRIGLRIFTPVSMASLSLIQSKTPGKLWAMDYSPPDHSAFDFTQRVVTVQTEVKGPLMDRLLLADAVSYKPDMEVELLRDGIVHSSVVPKRRPLLVGQYFSYINPGVFAFAPELFAPGAIVELRVRSGLMTGTMGIRERETTVRVPDELLTRIAADFDVYDRSRPLDGYVSPDVTNPFR